MQTEIQVASKVNNMMLVGVVLITVLFVHLI